MRTFAVAVLAVALCASLPAAYGSPGDRHHIVSSSCAGSVAVGTRSVKIACPQISYVQELAAAAAAGSVPSSGSVVASDFVKAVVAADKRPHMRLVGKTAGANPTQVFLSLTIVNATYDANTKVLSLTTRHLPTQLNTSAVQNLALATLYVVPMPTHVFYPAAKPDNKTFINVTDPKSVKAHPENSIKATASWPKVTKATYKAPQGRGKTGALAYTIASPDLKGTWRAVSGAKGKYTLTMKTAGAAVRWQAVNKPHDGNHPGNVAGFVGMWAKRIASNATVGVLSIHTSATSVCTAAFAFNSVQLSKDNSTVTYTITLADPKSSCGSKFTNLKSTVASSGQVLITATPLTAGDCTQLGGACVAPYLGGAFTVTQAFPYPNLPSSPTSSGMSSSSAQPMDQWTTNYSPFTIESIGNVASYESGDTFCSGSMSVSSFQSSNDARTSFAASASVSAKFWGVSGSASASYSTATQTMASGSSTFTAATVQCGIAAYSLPPDMYGLQVSPSMQSAVYNAINANYELGTLATLYQTFGSHFMSTVVLGGFVTTSMSSTSSSISSYSSSGLSVSAAISYGMASASGSASTSSSTGTTAQSQGWSWNAIMSPSASQAPALTFTNGAPNMVAYQNGLAAIALDLLVPVAFMTMDYTSTIFNPAYYNSLGWASVNVTSAQLTQLANIYDIFVNQCGGDVNGCLLNTYGCGNYGYSLTNGTLPQNSTVTPACGLCLEGLVDANAPYALSACPYFSASCWNNPASYVAAAPTNSPFYCQPQPGTLWSVPGPSGSMSSSFNCLYVNSSGAPNACLTSAGGEYSFCLQADSNIVLYDNWQTSTGSPAVVWAANTQNWGGGIYPYKLCMNQAGTLSASNSNGAEWWWPQTGSGMKCPGNGGPYYAVMQGDGNFVIYDKTQSPLYATNTNHWVSGQTATPSFVGACAWMSG